MRTINFNHTQRRRVAIIGSTGSIGLQTLDVVRAFPEYFQIVALAARRNSELLANQVNEFQPSLVVCTDDIFTGCAAEEGSRPEVLAGIEGLIAVATHAEVDMVVVASSGLVGVEPAISAIKAGKLLALANKEALVMAGHLVTTAARLANTDILPIDSEHSAIWQCLRGERIPEVRRLLLTASGGPFRSVPHAAMMQVSVEQALRHPTWQMGPKITIDSATLMNKGLEVIEAHWLFAMPYEKIEVVIHPQSIIHSMVEFVDNSIKMQASLPSMHLPIQNALSYPVRLDCAETLLARGIHWPDIGHLDFEAVDVERFPCLNLALIAGKSGGTAPAALVGADEQAVQLFLQGKLRLTDIAPIVEQILSTHVVVPEPSLNVIQETVRWAQQEVMRLYTLQKDKRVIDMQ